MLKKKQHTILSHKRLLEVLDYNPQTGIFTSQKEIP